MKRLKDLFNHRLAPLPAAILSAAMAILVIYILLEIARMLGW
jgi:hypothetical protein